MHGIIHLPSHLSQECQYRVLEQDHLDFADNETSIAKPLIVGVNDSVSLVHGDERWKYQVESLEKTTPSRWVWG